MTLRHGNLIDINIPYIIQGTLETISKETGAIIINLENMTCIRQWILHDTKDYLKLLVFDGQRHQRKQSNTGKSSISRKEILLLFIKILYWLTRICLKLFI